MPCKHTTLQFTPSPFAKLAGYKQASSDILAAAETISGKRSKFTATNISSHLFPGPLVLPHDDLNYEPDCASQSVKSWISMKIRNRLAAEMGRKTLYVAQIPDIMEEVDYMRDWSLPKDSYIEEDMGEDYKAITRRVDLFVEYLKSFYYGIDVEVLPLQLSWVVWNKTRHRQPSRRATIPKYVGLAYADNCTRIRVRSVPDHVFAAQLNLDDILDAAIEMLPGDAYAMCLMVDHDIYENEDDDFCCGRAYGGSRVAVVQTARYNPILDGKTGIDREHMWPKSHCKHFVDKMCEAEDVKPKPPTREQVILSRGGPMRAAVDGASTYPPISDLKIEYQSLWFSRLARTVSHELGHCFGIAHCVYYACNMQGTASMKEDVRQPPYLCPVCEAKIGYAIVRELRGGGNDDKAEWIKQRGDSLNSFCIRLEENGTSSAMWRGLSGWLTERRLLE